ncbi:Glycogen synthase [Roseovarius sp. THAF8]|nr:Glycogen synthase [Roseovarius sp. THAF8]
MTEVMASTPSRYAADDRVERVVVFNDHSSRNGGAAILALLLIQKLRERGLAVSFVTGDAGDNPELADLGVDVIAYGGSDLLSRSKGEALARGLHDAAAEKFVARAVSGLDGPGTVYHMHNWSQIFSPSVFRALRPVADRVFLHAHDNFLACPNGMYMNYRRGHSCPLVPLSAACWMTNCDKRNYAHKLWRAARHAVLFRHIDRQAPWAGVIAIHEQQVEKFRRAGYPERLLRVVRNPAEPYTATRVEAEENDLLVYVGRLERDKGVMDLVEAAARTGQRLRLIGVGDLHDRIERDYPTVELAGWQPADRIGALVADARALVMPSRHPETFGLVIAEAAQCGLPVLVSDQTALAADVERLGCGLAFDVFDPADVDAKLSRIRDMNSAEVAGMSRRGFSDGSLLSTTPDSWADMLVELYGAAVAR